MKRDYRWTGFRELCGVQELKKLREAVGILNADDAQAVAKYLDSGVIYTHFEEEGVDRLNVDIELEPPTLMTDGFWVWRSDTSYYVRTYRASLEPAFMRWALARKTVDPNDVDSADLGEWLNRKGWLSA